MLRPYKDDAERFEMLRYRSISWALGRDYIACLIILFAT